ncbi:MAG: PRTRC system protein B [Bacteroidetes bacterium]|nr:PRTRC system protein B [Bacteroidota bacterium]
MTDITASFGTLYHPVKAIMVYREQGNQQGIYIESYDMGADGCPCNAHPLTVRESQSLAKALMTGTESEQRFLQPSGLLPHNLLHIRYGKNGYAIWHTPPQRVKLLFKDGLTIPTGEASVPALLWRAGRGQLALYALRDEPLQLDTPLYFAPFFNIYADGRVCMGSVQVDISADCTLEHFISQWQDYFFGSYFSHLIGQRSPVKGNIVQLWKGLVGKRKAFPNNVLVKNGHTIKNLLQ